MKLRELLSCSRTGTTERTMKKALPCLVRFFTSIRKVSDIPFDVNRAAQLELEWWIIHRQRHTPEPGALDRALGELAPNARAVL
jgi:hypothetical protein